MHSGIMLANVHCADDGKVDSLVGKTVWRSRDASAVTDINSKNGGDASEAGFRNL